MRNDRFSVCRIAALLAAALSFAAAHAGDAADAWRPPAGDLPAFEAPAEPPSGRAAEPAAEEAVPLTLRDALALSLLRNPGLAAYSWEVRAGEARALQAGKLANPEVAFRYYRLNATAPVTKPEDSARRVILSEALELGGKRGRRVDLAHAERDVAGRTYDTQRNAVAAEVTGRFAAVLGAQRTLASWRGLVTFLEGTAERVSHFVEIGSLPAVEVHEVKRRLGLARVELARAETGLSADRLRLASTWGSRLPVFTVAVGDLEEIAPVPPIESVVELVRTSPESARFDAEVTRGGAAVAAAKASRIPDLTLGVGTRWDENARTRDYLLDLRFSVPVFDRKRGDVLEARYDLARIEARRRAAESATTDGIADSYYPLLESDRRRATLADEVLPAATAAFEAHRMGLEVRQEKPEDVIDARVDLAKAEIDYTDALVDYHQARARLEGLLGRGLGDVYLGTP
jgi:cobalt-zinc-cadmium efflux system outer membrane protein